MYTGPVVPVEHGEVAVPGTPESEPGKAAVLNRSIPLPEVMYNELVFSQVEQEAMRMGLTVVTNKCRVDDASLTKNVSVYAKSRPEVVIFDWDTLVTYVVQGVTTELESEEKDMIIQGGMTENKLLIKTNLGQLLAGMEKVAGDIASIQNSILNFLRSPGNSS